MGTVLSINRSFIKILNCCSPLSSNDFKQVLGNEPMEVHDDQIRVLEKYILSIYFPRIEITGDINIDRMNSFRKIPNGNLRLIPFSRFGLLENTKRACIQSGWL